MSEAEGFTLTPLTRLAARLVSHDWAWARENGPAIGANWERRRATRPSLFDGLVFLACGCTIEDAACTVDLFETRYSRFIAFRDAGSPDPAVFNAFSAIVPVTADGAILLGIMGGHTANAGQIYFPCGTPDRDDLRADGSVDLAGSAAREFAEETGLALPPETARAPWALVRGEGQLAFLRPVRFAQDEASLIARIAAHHAGDAQPELAGMVAARHPGDVDIRHMPGFVRAYLDEIWRARDPG